MASTFGEAEWVGFYPSRSCTFSFLSIYFKFYIVLMGHYIKATKETHGKIHNNSISFSSDP